MKRILIFGGLAFLLLSLPVFAANDNLKKAIVKVYTTYNTPNYAQPWQMNGQLGRTGSGVIISRQRILSNAHILSDQTFIQVRLAGQADKFVARLESVSHDLDLAILRVDDQRFFKDSMALEVGELPQIGDRVTAYGFPLGGTRITITEGVVSRIDRSEYAHSGFANMVSQIDASINEGSSGGPVISNGKIAGIIFQSQSGQNIGYMVPAPVIHHFLNDLADGHHDGVPGFPILWQNLENEQSRRFYGMKESMTGILLNEVGPAIYGVDKLLPGDILLQIDGHNIANDGTAPFRANERIAFAYLVDRKQINDNLTVKLLRKGKVMESNVLLSKSKAQCDFIPRIKYETPPSYYIIGGLVFTKLTKNYLALWNNPSEIPIRLQEYYLKPRLKSNEKRKDVIVMMDVLSDEVNIGFQPFEDSIVSTVNGRKINDMHELVDSFESNRSPYDRIVFEPYGSEIVLSRAELRKRGQLILEKYKVPSDRSADLQDTLKVKSKLRAVKEKGPADAGNESGSP